jgi:transposase
MTNFRFNEGELDKICILKQIEDKGITQQEGAEKLGLSTRQIRRIQKKIKTEGPIGIKSKAKGGNRTFKLDFKNNVIEIVSKNYADFGPTFAAEKLLECHKIEVSKETLRQWMIESGLRKQKKRKAARIHQTRHRRPRFGELVQIDGSHHDWFEGRGPKCCLYVFIDDATSRILWLRFELTETTNGYFRCVDDYIKTYGRPLSYYSDRHSIFKTTRANPSEDVGATQFHRALTELGITLICARSPQAKGRVERANKTLQDRLIKEMRLSGISSIEDANVYLPVFMAAHNQKFAVPADDPEDAHRLLNTNSETLNRILSCQEERTLSKNLECRYQGQILQVQSQGGGYHLRHAKVMVCAHMNGSIEILRQGKSLVFQQHIAPKEPLTAERKDIDGLFETDILVSPVLRQAGWLGTSDLFCKYPEA